VTEVRDGQAAGWRADPYGRHELRFFDGTRWTPYVRDAGADGVDEPGGPLGEVRQQSRSALLTDELFVVERSTELGRRWSDRAVLRADGTRAGTLRRAAPGVNRTGGGLKGLVARDQAKNDVVELVDDKQAVVVTLVRPVGAPKSSVEVHDSEGRDAGRIVQQSIRRNETTYSLLGPNGRFLGDLQAENWVSWNLRMVDAHARQVATITREWTGLDPATFPRPDDYVVRIDDSVNEPLRTLVVACALSLEVVVRPDSLGL
jgi:Protein of unknown function (DUF2510)/Scramblase